MVAPFATPAHGVAEVRRHNCVRQSEALRRAMVGQYCYLSGMPVAILELLALAALTVLTLGTGLSVLGTIGPAPILPFFLLAFWAAAELAMMLIRSGPRRAQRAPLRAALAVVIAVPCSIPFFWDEGLQPTGAVIFSVMLVSSVILVLEWLYQRRRLPDAYDLFGAPAEPGHRPYDY